uniref:Uncharacterized protein n=1 Tax=Erpetoichthys calabaricus TaxID=27687 RepID=A0A8C4SEM0_ERPCA
SGGCVILLSSENNDLVLPSLEEIMRKERVVGIRHCGDYAFGHSGVCLSVSWGMLSTGVTPEQQIKLACFLPIDSLAISELINKSNASSCLLDPIPDSSAHP